MLSASTVTCVVDITWLIKRKNAQHLKVKSFTLSVYYFLLIALLSLFNLLSQSSLILKNVAGDGSQPAFLDSGTSRTGINIAI
jgi:hypothetical protein